MLEMLKLAPWNRDNEARHLPVVHSLLFREAGKDYVNAHSN